TRSSACCRSRSAGWSSPRSTRPSRRSLAAAASAGGRQPSPRRTGAADRAATVRGVALGLTPAYAALCAVQGALVLAPRRPRRLGRSWAVGLVVPLAALVIGVLAIRGTSDGADALASLATVAAPLLAAVTGPALGWRLPWLTVPAAGVAYLVAWRADGLVADLAGGLPIGGGRPPPPGPPRGAGPAPPLPRAAPRP